MPLLTAQTSDASALGAALDAKPSLLVVCLCAEWCDTCREFRPALARLSQLHAAATFVWLDVEDDSALAGDIDIENFPTLAVYRDGQPLFFGVTLPQGPLVGRTLAALAAADAQPVSVPAQVARLPQTLAEHAQRVSRG